jgi:hypothetical protein
MSNQMNNDKSAASCFEEQHYELWIEQWTARYRDISKPQTFCKAGFKPQDQNARTWQTLPDILFKRKLRQALKKEGSIDVGGGDDIVFSVVPIPAVKSD